MYVRVFRARVLMCKYYKINIKTLKILVFLLIILPCIQTFRIIYVVQSCSKRFFCRHICFFMLHIHTEKITCNVQIESLTCGNVIFILRQSNKKIRIIKLSPGRGKQKVTQNHGTTQTCIKNFFVHAYNAKACQMVSWFVFLQAFIQAVLLMSIFEQRLSFRMLKNKGGCLKLLYIPQWVHSRTQVEVHGVKPLKNFGLFTSG